MGPIIFKFVCLFFKQFLRFYICIATGHVSEIEHFKEH